MISKIKMVFAVLLIFFICGIAEGIIADDSIITVFLKIVVTIISMYIVGWLSKPTNNNGAQETEH